MLARYDKLIRLSISLQSFSGRYQPESASAKTHTTAGMMTSGSHSAASRGNAAAVCSELSNGKQAPPTSWATTGTQSACKFSSTANSNNTMSECSRDRLGQWPVESDSEVAGGVSGFGRLHNGRFNKVSAVWGSPVRRYWVMGDFLH